MQTTKKLILVAAAVILAAVTTAARTDGTPGLVESEYNRPGVATSFVAGKDWFPYPHYTDRKAWSEIFAADSARTVSQGEKYLDFEWKYIPATAYLAFERTGDRKAMENPEGANRGALISLFLAELAEGKGRFIDQLVDGVWHASQQPSWVLSAHTANQKSGRSLPSPYEQLIDLASGRYGAIIALIWHFFHEEFDKIDPVIGLSVENAMEKNIFKPYIDPDEYASNWWIGFTGHNMNNWTPWCTSDVILAYLLMERDQETLDKAIAQSCKSMDIFLDYIQKDGACEEGPAYWGAAAGKTFEYLQIMHDASGGMFDLMDNPRIRKMGEYVSRAYIGNNYVVNFADASALNSNPAPLVWNYGKAAGSKEMTDFALYLLADAGTCRFRQPVQILNDGYRALYTSESDSHMKRLTDSLNSAIEAAGGTREAFEAVRSSLRAKVPASTWYPETEHCFLRNGSGWFLGAKGGYNDESHNHNDVGTFILYIRDTPVFVDAGVGTYTRQTFSRTERYSIWSMQCDWHNLPMINSVAQQFGRQYRSSDPECDIERGRFTVGMAGAYPENASCESWVRSYRLSGKGKPSVTVTDTYRLSERTAPDIEHFLVKGDVILPGEIYDGRKIPSGTLLIQCDNGITVRLQYPSGMTASAEVKTLEDKAMSKVWGESLTRISLVSREDSPLKGSYSFTITEVK